MQILLLTQVRLTKAAEALRAGHDSPVWDALGLDGWTQAPRVSAILKQHPGLSDDLRHEIASAFSPKGSVNLFRLLDFPIETFGKYGIRSGEARKIAPFETYESPGRDHVLVFDSHIRPRLATNLPAELDGLTVDPADLENAFLITLETLSEVDIHDLAESAEETDFTGDIPIRDCLNDIAEVLDRAKGNEADVIANFG